MGGEEEEEEQPVFSQQKEENIFLSELAHCQEKTESRTSDHRVGQTLFHQPNQRERRKEKAGGT